MSLRLKICCVVVLVCGRVCVGDPPTSVPNYGWSDRFAGDPSPWSHPDYGTGCITYLDVDADGPALLTGPAYQPVSRWPGNSWDAVNYYTFSGIKALATFDPNGVSYSSLLYSGSAFEGYYNYGAFSYLRDGHWQYVEQGIIGQVWALSVFDDGNGPALYAAGTFTVAGGQPASNIVRWDGTQWKPLGLGVGGQGSAAAVYCMTVRPSDRGPRLVVGGRIRLAGGNPVNYVAEWDGEVWTPLGQGVNGPVGDTTVRALTVFDDGEGPQLYAGGHFNSAGTAAANNVARWDGQSWSAAGAGTNGEVYALASFSTPSGPRLAAAGDFSIAGPSKANRVAQWDGSNWSSMGDGLGDPSSPFDSFFVHTLHGWEDERGPQLAAGGYFDLPDSHGFRGMATWDGKAWHEFYFEEKQNAFGVGAYTAQPMQCFAVLDTDGDGPRPPTLYMGGYLEYSWNHAATGLINGVARWIGNGWDSLGDGVEGWGDIGLNVRAMAAMDDDGPGPLPPVLYVAGSFDSAGGQPAKNVARWDETTQTWSSLGTGVKNMARALAVWDRGEGPVLYVGGHFESAGDQDAAFIAAWNPRMQTWSSLNSGMDAQVNAIAIFDDGSGEALYAGGRFTKAGGQNCAGIAKWDGANWTPVGGGVGGEYAAVYVLKVYDDGSGPQLYAGGLFETAGGVPAHYIARWNGHDWSAVGGGLFGGLAYDIYNGVLALEEFDDGHGKALYAGGYFTETADELAVGLAKWDGVRWTQVGGGLRFADSYPGSATQGLISFDDGTGPALWIAGFFDHAGNMPSVNLARWQPVPPQIALEPLATSSCDGGHVALSVKATGKSPLRYQWRRYGVNVQNGGAISGADGPQLSIDPVNFGNGGSYDVVVEDDIGRVISTSAELEVFPSRNAIQIEPATQTTCVGGTARFEVTPSGLAPVTYAWRKNGALIAGANDRVLVLDPVAQNDGGFYEGVVSDSCGVRSASAMLAVGPSAPVFSVEPVDIVTCNGSSAVFHVVVQGSMPFVYQWRWNGADIPGATDETFSIQHVSNENLGFYDVVVTDRCGMSTSHTAQLSLGATGPAISEQPANQTTAWCPHGYVSFHVGATGHGTLYYSWFHNGQSVTTVTDPTLVIGPLNGTEAGSYSVAVIDDCGQTMSQTATLTFTDPYISEQPQSQSACPGVDVSLHVVASGRVDYYWYRGSDLLSDNGHISGSRTSTLTVHSVNDYDFGYYSVQIAFESCAVSSAIAYILPVEPGTGDGNDDGIYDPTDVQAFIGVLLSDNPSAPENCRFDMNYDGLINGADIQVFIYYYTGWY